MALILILDHHYRRPTCPGRVAVHSAFFRQFCLTINVLERTYFEQYMAEHTLNSNVCMGPKQENLNPILKKHKDSEKKESQLSPHYS